MEPELAFFGPSGAGAGAGAGAGFSMMVPAPESAPALGSPLKAKFSVIHERT